MTGQNKLRVRDIPDIEEYRRRGWWKGRLYVDLLEAHVARTPDKPAIIDSRGALSFAGLRARSRNLAAALIGLGMEPGDVVAIQAPNWAELLVTHMAADRVGMIFLPLHDGFRDREIAHLLTVSRARTVIYPAAFHGFAHRDMMDRIAPSLPGLQNRIVLRADASRDERHFDDLVADGSWESRTPRGYLERFRPGSSEPLQVMVSSGTTAMPRCSILCDDAMIFRTVQQYGHHACRLSEHDVAAAIAPAGTGATGYSYPVLAPIMLGGTSVMLERWDGNNPGAALDMMAEHGCTFAVMIPTQLTKLVEEQAKRPRAIPLLRWITNAGARLPTAVAKTAEELFGCVVQTIYGATDGGVPTMTLVDDPPDKRATAGRLLEGMQMRLVDDRGDDVPPGMPGEILWRGPNTGFGYLNDPEGTSSIWDDEGWYHSGDIGQVDAEGYLSIVGRKKDMIIRGGRNINPGMIEEALVRHPGVVDVAVIAAPHDTLGEIACAAIVPAAGARPDLAELGRFLLDQGMAVWSQPERMLLLRDLPRNAGGKVDKKALAQLLDRDLAESGGGGR